VGGRRPEEECPRQWTDPPKQVDSEGYERHISPEEVSDNSIAIDSRAGVGVTLVAAA
jgi:hypothetical protein